jgi:hypothetical protein
LPITVAAVQTQLVFAGQCHWVFTQVESDERLTGLGEATL